MHHNARLDLEPPILQKNSGQMKRVLRFGPRVFQRAGRCPRGQSGIWNIMDPTWARPTVHIVGVVAGVVASLYVQKMLAVARADPRESVQTHTGYFQVGGSQKEVTLSPPQLPRPKRGASVPPQTPTPARCHNG